MSSVTARRSHRARVLGAYVVLGLVAAACGDDDDAGTADTDAATETDAPAGTSAPAGPSAPTDAVVDTTEGTTAATGDTTATTGVDGAGETSGPADESMSPIKIGVATAQTGPPSSSFRHVPGTVNAWAEWVNSEKGGINGHPVEIAIQDTKGDSASALAAGTELVEGEGVVAVIIDDSTAEGALGEYLSSQNVAVIGGSTNNPSVQGVLPNYFTNSTTFPASPQGMVLVGRELGAASFSAVVCAEVAACAATGDVYSATAPEVGIEYLGLIAVAASAPNYTAECLNLIGQGSEFILVTTAAAVALRVAADCTAQGFEGWYGAVSNSVIAEDFESVEGMRLSGHIGGFPWWADDPAVEEFRSVMEEYNSDDYRDPAATNAWASLELFREVMADASDEPTNEEVLDAYTSIEDETLGGLFPQPLTFTQGEPAPLVSCFWMYQMVNGEFSSLESDQPSGNGADGDLKSACWPPAEG